MGKLNPVQERLTPLVTGKGAAVSGGIWDCLDRFHVFIVSLVFGLSTAAVLYRRENQFMPESGSKYHNGIVSGCFFDFFSCRSESFLESVFHISKPIVSAIYDLSTASYTPDME